MRLFVGKRCGSALSGAVLAVVRGTAAQAQAPSDLPTRMQDPNQWVMAARDYANTRFSPLDQIHTDNAKQLHLAWTFFVGADRWQEAAPIFVDNTMYVVGPYAGPYP